MRFQFDHLICHIRVWTICTMWGSVNKILKQSVNKILKWKRVLNYTMRRVFWIGKAWWNRNIEVLLHSCITWFWSWKIIQNILTKALVWVSFGSPPKWVARQFFSISLYKFWSQHFSSFWARFLNGHQIQRFEAGDNSFCMGGPDI